MGGLVGAGGEHMGGGGAQSSVSQLKCSTIRHVKDGEDHWHWTDVMALFITSYPTPRVNLHPSALKFKEIYVGQIRGLRCLNSLYCFVECIGSNSGAVWIESM